jgi:hypothetical protein
MKKYSLKFAYQKSLLHDFRLKQLQLIYHCMQQYQKTKDKDYLGWAKNFGEWSLYFKKEIEKLS